MEDTEFFRLRQNRSDRIYMTYTTENVDCEKLEAVRLLSA